MRKSLCFFLWGLVFIFTSLPAKAFDIKDIEVFPALRKPLIQSQFAFPDSLKATKKDTVYHKKYRLVAALLAFPLGIFGLHRMYLGTSNKVSFIYIVTIGGVFGTLPFIDFVQILLSKNIHKTYTNNQHLFMWRKR